MNDMNMCAQCEDARLHAKNGGCSIPIVEYHFSTSSFSILVHGLSTFGEL